MSFTFPVNDVSKSKSYYTLKSGELRRGYKGLGNFEAYGGPSYVVEPDSYAGTWQSPRNGLWLAVHTAFLAHKRLILGPDHIWLTIAKIAAEHLTKRSEELRSKFVSFDGTKKLEVRNDTFVKGSDSNNWPSVFDAFKAQIDANVSNELTSIFDCTFSTSGPLEKAVSRILLMDAVSKYFKFEFQTLSGIPEITVLGTPEDWVTVGKRIVWLQEKLELGDWGEHAYALTRQFYYASKGQPDTKWWQSFYRQMGGSGGDSFDGHLTTLFPRYDGQGTLVIPKRVHDDKIPHHLSRVPFIWKYYDQEFRMRFVAGLPFATLVEGAVTPAASWAIEELR